jgi:hypothetical protein
MLKQKEAAVRCPFCRTQVRRGAISCPTCRARISYGCTVPVTGCLLPIVVAFLVGCGLIGLFSEEDATGARTIPQNLLIGIGIFSAFLGLGLWLLMVQIAKRFISFSRRRRD